MRKLLIIFGVALMLPACKEGGIELPPQEARDKNFSEIEERIFVMIEQQRFSQESNGFTFAGNSSQADTERLFYLTIGGVLTSFNFVSCGPVYDSNGEFVYNQISASYYSESNLLYKVSIFHDIVFSGFEEVVIYTDGRIEAFFNANSDKIHISDESGDIDNIELSRRIFDLSGNFIAEEYTTISGTITCPN